MPRNTNCVELSGVEDIRRRQQQKDKTHAIIKATGIDRWQLMSFRDYCFKTLRLRHPATSSRRFRRIHVHCASQTFPTRLLRNSGISSFGRITSYDARGGEDLAYPEHAKLGWRRLDSFSDSQWQELVARFESGLAEAADIAGQTRLAERYSTLEEPGSGTGPLTLLELIVNLAVHNAYHLGRIVQLRQISGCWPPPAGGDTW